MAYFRWQVADYSILGLQEGEHWPLQLKMIDKDKNEVDYLKDNGWTLLRFWETDINKDIDACIKKVIDTLCEIKERETESLINNICKGS
jgi:very-short-patch-repair endonuclease